MHKTFFCVVATIALIICTKHVAADCVGTAGALRVPAGQTCSLHEPLPIFLSSLVMEDNSTLAIIAAPVWRVTIRSAEFGNNTTIDLGGGNGRDAPDTPGEGPAGGRAADGVQGGSGANGHSLVMTVGIKRLVRLRINNSGGKGGRGGQGQKAGRGENGTCDTSRSGDAGEPGDGGLGGNGGDTGAIEITWFDASTTSRRGNRDSLDEQLRRTDESPAGLLVVGTPGAPGDGGFGGDGNSAGSRACGCFPFGDCRGLGTGSPSKTHVQRRGGHAGQEIRPRIVRLAM